MGRWHANGSRRIVAAGHALLQQPHEPRHSPAPYKQFPDSRSFPGVRHLLMKVFTKAAKVTSQDLRLRGSSLSTPQHRTAYSPRESCCLPASCSSKVSGTFSRRLNSCKLGGVSNNTVILSIDFIRIQFLNHDFFFLT